MPPRTTRNSSNTSGEQQNDGTTTPRTEQTVEEMEAENARLEAVIQRAALAKKLERNRLRVANIKAGRDEHYSLETEPIERQRNERETSDRRPLRKAQAWGPYSKKDLRHLNNWITDGEVEFRSSLIRDKDQKLDLAYSSLDGRYKEKMRFH